MRGVAAVCCLLAVLSCQGDAWIVAEALPPEESLAEPPLERPDLVAIPGECPSAADVLAQREMALATSGVGAAHVGRWRGVLKGAKAAGFPSSEVELELDASGVGTFRFDVAPSPIEPLPATGYLCSAAPTGVVCGSDSGFVGGFSYAVAGARSQGEVLSFVLRDADPWGAWCGLSASVALPDPSQACGFSFGVRLPAEPRWSPDGCTLRRDQEVEPIDCELLYALERCECARDGCFAAFDGGVEVGLALAQDGIALGGSLWYENGVDRAQVTLARVP